MNVDNLQWGIAALSAVGVPIGITLTDPGYQPYRSDSPWERVSHWNMNRVPTTTRRKLWEPTRSVTSTPEEVQR